MQAELTASLLPRDPRAAARLYLLVLWGTSLEGCIAHLGPCCSWSAFGPVYESPGSLTLCPAWVVWSFLCSSFLWISAVLFQLLSSAKVFQSIDFAEQMSVPYPTWADSSPWWTAPIPASAAQGSTYSSTASHFPSSSSCSLPWARWFVILLWSTSASVCSISFQILRHLGDSVLLIWWGLLQFEISASAAGVLGV